MKSLIRDMSRDFSEAHFSCGSEAPLLLLIIGHFPDTLDDLGPPVVLFSFFKDSEAGLMKSPGHSRTGTPSLAEVPLISFWREQCPICLLAGGCSNSTL